MNHTLKSSEKGFDFGTAYRVAIASDMDFGQHLHNAGVFGCSYGLWPVPSLKTSIPSISLVGYDADELRLAFTMFHRWAEGTDHDAVDFTIVFLKAGGYILGIAPDYNRCEARTTAGDPLLDPMVMGLTWVKPIDTVHPMLLKIKERHENALIAPIAITACINDRGTALSPQSLRPINDIEPLIKFSCCLVDEDDVKNSTAEIILRLHRAANKKRGARVKFKSDTPPPRSKADWAKKRRRVLDHVFPVTRFRAAQSSLLDITTKSLGNFHVRDWQIHQAIANLVISRGLCDEQFHYPCVAKSDMAETVITAARKYVESSGRPDRLSGIGPELVAKQIELDIRYLLKESGVTIPSGTLQKLQRKLISSGLCS